ncbi:hypothetical protein KXW38_007982 [Aspergillus fumigatus]|nr:hypothetical protein KXW38_007982 [Aspergillus fumigatus]
MSEYKVAYESELDSYQLYYRYDNPPPEKDWKRAALRGPALPAVGNAVAGAVGAAISNVVTYPLSLIVTRLQTQAQRRTKKKNKSESEDLDEEEDEEYTDVLDATRKIYAKEGLGSFYTGLAQDTVKTVADSFLFFLAYGFFRQRRIRARYGDGRRSKHVVLPILDELAIGVLAGAFAKLFTTPLANIVARKQAAPGKKALSTKDIAARIKTEKGLRGFWSGYSASLILTLNPSITFFLNEVLKYALLSRKKRGKPSPATTFLLAAISKSAASSITYPFSMAKTRAQVDGSGNSGKPSIKSVSEDGISFAPQIIMDVLAIARNEGVSALYAGLPGEVLKGFFSHGFTMLAKDAVYSLIVQSYYLLLIVLRRYPTPEELIQRAREQAEEFAEAAREGARDPAEKAKEGAEEMLEHHPGHVSVDTASTAGSSGVDASTGYHVGSDGPWSDTNPTAELVRDYVEDDTTEWKELLYQPLTLLNCLHTFCGSCLKEWFAAQASRRRPSSSIPQFTCPACRAVVRDTRPNATVTTLLDMVLAANPERVKSAEEKEEVAQRYKHGESVFPVLSSSGQDGTASDVEDRRLLEEVRELSLRESRAGTGQSSRSRQAESVDADGRRADGRSRRRREEERVLRRQPGARTEDNSERTRRIEHQSSLRSLLSFSDTETMEEEILRQIIEDGLLNGIDLDNLGPAQEEELTERIADAYRRRHMRRPRSRQRQEADEEPQASPRPRARSQSVQRPPASPTPQPSSRNPPVSRPYLLEPLVSRSEGFNHQRRLSDQGTRRRRTSPAPVNAASTSEDALRPAARSSSDIASDRPRPSQSSRARAAELSTAPRPRPATASEQNVPNIFTPEARNRDLRQPVSGRPLNFSPASVASPSTPNHSFSARLEHTTAGSPVCSSPPAVGSPANPRSRPSSSRSHATQRPSATFTEPSISCDRCGKQNIQYELHKKCLQCKDGNFHICLRCYRLGRGCLQWAGFGPSAEVNFDRMLASSTGQPMPSPGIAHVLQFSRYLRPAENVHRTSSGTELTSDDPAQRLQTGLFCDICHAVANKCYWKCNDCNQGDWGFCNKCVNRGRCCTHALLPVCRLAPGDRSSAPVPAGSDLTDGPSHPSAPPTTADTGNEIYRILSFSTKCDICTYPIPASATRFHCLECNEGDYDVCANCYLKLVATGKISKENGHNGWRRCVRGHRMVVVGFEDHNEGQRRVVVRDLVGGRALKDEHAAAVPTPEVGTGDWSWKEGSERRKKASRVRTSWAAASNDRSNSFPMSAPGGSGSGSGSGPSSETATPTSSHSPPFLRRFPPDGGIGLIVHALWSWYPEDDVQDELMFPRGAEITEVENINDDWFWGCYAGQTGLFPGSHVTVVGEIV